MPSFLNSRHAPFLFFSVSSKNIHFTPGIKPIHSCWRLLFSQGRRQLRNKQNELPQTSLSIPPPTLHYFLVASGAAGAGVAAGAGGAGASAGFASSLAAGFSGALALHPTPIAAKLITKTSASKRKIHFFMCFHLLSALDGNPLLFYPMKRPSLRRENKSPGSLSSIISVQRAFS